MLIYPSIPAATGQKFREIPDAQIFDKLDGSSLQAEWSRKRGWYKHGRREGLLDHQNPQLLEAPTLFDAQLAEPLARLARALGFQQLVVFYEFWGAQSVAGVHVAADPKFLTVFDAAWDKRGIMPPSDFRRAFEDMVPTAKYLGTTNWTRGYVERVRRGEIAGVTFEGVVAKFGDRQGIIRAKAKTQAWIDKIRAIHGSKADEIINS